MIGDEEIATFDPVAVIYVPSRTNGAEIAVYQLPSNRDLVYEFSLKRRTASGDKFVCCGCRANKNKLHADRAKPLPTTTIENGLFLTDPEHTITPHFCVPRDADEVFNGREAFVRTLQSSYSLDSHNEGMEAGSSTTFQRGVADTGPSSVSLQNAPPSDTLCTLDCSNVPSSSHNHVELDDTVDESHNILYEEITHHRYEEENENRPCTSGEFEDPDHFEEADMLPEDIVLQNSKTKTVIRNSPFDPVAVIFVPSRKNGSYTAVYPLRNNPTLVYEFSLKRRNASGATFACCGCRTLNTKFYADSTKPLPTTTIEGGLFLTDPENTTNPHFCGPKDAETVFQGREAFMSSSYLQKHSPGSHAEEMEAGHCQRTGRDSGLSSVGIKHPPSTNPRESSDVPGTSKNHVRIEDIDDDTYNVFCDEILGRPVEENKADRTMIDKMCSCGEFGVLDDFEDDYLGVLPAVIVQLQSEKYILSPSMRMFYIEHIISKVKTEKNPISIALQEIQEKFIGFPPVMKLRGLLFEELDRQVPGFISTEHRRAMNASIPISKSPDNIEVSTGNSTANCEPSTSGISGDSQAASSLMMKNKCIARTLPKERVSKRPLLPIDDHIYDLVAEVLSNRTTLNEIVIPHHRVQVQDQLTTEMQCELWNVPKQMCPAGWRLIAGGKIIPRKSEVAEIWRVCYENLAQTHAPAEMLQFVEERFHGISTKTLLKDATKHELFRGSRVQFHQAPRFIGFKPMQYVQVDVIDFEETLYGDHYYSQALIVTDLYSGFCFGRALSFGSDQSFIVRHLMDIFGTFAPPQGYRSWSVQSSEAIQEVMVDIEQLFKVTIKNLGLANSCTNQLVRGIYNRAENHLGSKSRWVEALPFAIMDYNQKPNKQFEMALSPFEIMFGRRPWKSDDVPPWIDKNAVEAEIRLFEQKKNGEKENDTAPGKKKKRKRVLPTDIVIKKELLPFTDVGNQPKDTATVNDREKIRLTLRNPYPPLFDVDGKLNSAGTGHLFEPGDKVFVKNPVYDIRLRPKKPPPNPLARYFRGCILYRDDKDVNFLYRVVYWDDDANVVEAMDPQLWPAPGDGYDCGEGWFSPWDITPSTPHIAKERAVVIRRQLPPPPDVPAVSSGARCRCGVAECKAFFNLKCPNKLSAKCCNKLPKPCNYHSKPVAVGTPPNIPIKKEPFASNLSLITFDRMRARGIKVEPYASSYKSRVKREIKSPERDPRWGFDNGKLVAFDGPPARRSLPQSVAERMARFTNMRRDWPPKINNNKPKVNISNVEPKKLLKEVKIEVESQSVPETETPSADLSVAFVEEVEDSTSFAEPTTSIQSPAIRKSCRIPKPKKFSDDESRSPSSVRADTDSTTNNLRRVSNESTPTKNSGLLKNTLMKGSALSLSEASSRRTEIFLARKRCLKTPDATPKMESIPTKRIKESAVRIPTLLELKQNMDCFRIKELQGKCTE